MASLLLCPKLLEGVEIDRLFLVFRVETCTWPSNPACLPLRFRFSLCCSWTRLVDLSPQVCALCRCHLQASRLPCVWLIPHLSWYIPSLGQFRDIPLSLVLSSPLYIIHNLVSPAMSRVGSTRINTSGRCLGSRRAVRTGSFSLSPGSLGSTFLSGAFLLSLTLAHPSI